MGVYNKAFTEISEIFKYLPERTVTKIPSYVVKTIEHNRDFDYDFKIDETKPFQDQKFMYETYLILAILYRDYWAPEGRVKLIRVKEQYKLKKETEELQKRYSKENIFRKNDKK